MYTAGWLLSSLFALTATALPTTNLASRSSGGSNSDTINIEVCNQCDSTKHFGLYQITSAFNMLSHMNPITIPSNGTQTITAPYKQTGMRLSGHAEWGLAGQWKTQALFEFGYSQYGDLDGTAYNLSKMDGSEDDEDVGLAVYPTVDGEACDECPSKICTSGNCDLSQAWTDPDQTADGSPADTVCYKGKPAFKVVFCPSA